MTYLHKNWIFPDVNVEARALNVVAWAAYHGDDPSQFDGIGFQVNYHHLESLYVFCVRYSTSHMATYLLNTRMSSFERNNHARFT